MAAGTEVTQPVGVLDAGYKAPPRDKCFPLETNERPEAPSTARPPRPYLVPALRQSYSTPRLSTPDMPDGLDKSGNLSGDPPIHEDRASPAAEFMPVIRSGVFTDIGARPDMEDEYVCIDHLENHLGSKCHFQGPCSYYGVFDGHGGRDAALFVKERLLGFIVDDASFPHAMEDVAQRAFLRADAVFAEVCATDESKSSGTTVITALVMGRNLFVSNVGDCRAVLSRKGQAEEMSRDHKTSCVHEQQRVEAAGGYIDDGYLNGQLAVTRALGNWHMQGLKAKGGGGPLIAEAETRQALLTEEDEFLVIGCDGLWDVFTSQNAVNFARRRLQHHNDPGLCCQELVEEALLRDTRDNITVVIVCFRPDPPPARPPPPPFRARRSISAVHLRNLQQLLENDHT